MRFLKIIKFIKNFRFSQVNANPLNILKTGVQKSKNQVQSDIQQLERLRNNVVQDTIFKIKNNWIEEMRRRNDYSNPVIDAIRVSNRFVLIEI